MSDSAVANPRAKNAVTGLKRRLPIGAEYQGDGASHVRVWAPAVREVEVVCRASRTPLGAEGSGYFGGVVIASPGDRYQFRLGDDDRLYPDPASRFQPDGPHGASEIVDPGAFEWTDQDWRGVSIRGQVVYEMHIGTFTDEGTFAGAMRELADLRQLGVTIVEVMPVAEFEGRFGWGYDGVDLYAPFHHYGTPDDFRRFVDHAHTQGIAVMLDVVYNHLGPSGNYLKSFSPRYFSDRYDNEWGEAINFDGPDSGPARELFIANAGYWIDEFHLDGLRLDATQQIFDASADHVIAAIARRAREAAGSRSIVLVAENERQETRLARPPNENGYGLDGLWNDDFHHSATVALTGRSEAYYSDTTGTAQELISAAKYGFLFQGQQYAWQRKTRGTTTWGMPPQAFVAFLENHDQVANSARGERAHRQASPGRWRAMTALLLLAPSTPMLFQGQEFGSSAPFLYFADFSDRDLATAVKRGRAEFLRQFPSVEQYERGRTLDDPGDPATFARCKLDRRERASNAPALALHRDLLRLRRDDAAFSAQAIGQMDGAVLNDSAFVLRFFTPGHQDDRVLIVNLGRKIVRDSISEPLLAPPDGCDWTPLWSTEDPAYGGSGLADMWPDECWRIPAESAIVLAPGSCRPRPFGPYRRTA